MRRLTKVNALLLAFTAVLILSCGSMAKVQQAAARQQRANILKQIGLAYYQFVDDAKNKGQAPKTAADLQLLLTAMAANEASVALTDGSVVFIYGVKVMDMTQGTSNTVLAYDANVAALGGTVLFGDGSVRYVTPAEFGALILATPGKAPDEKKDDKKAGNGDKK